MGVYSYLYQCNYIIIYITIYCFNILYINIFLTNEIKLYIFIINEMDLYADKNYIVLHIVKKKKFFFFPVYKNCYIDIQSI